MTENNSRIQLRSVMPETSRAQYAVTDTIIARATELGIPRAVLELAFVRVSQVNRCAYCTDVHSRLATKFYTEAGESAEDITRKFALAPGWREAAGVYTDLERAGLDIAEAVTSVEHGALPDEDYDRLRAQLGDDVLTVFLMGCINMNVFNRIHLFSHTVVGQP
ncbi:carboxymuconolactone decarboxylase family protein [Corynebacterium phoceense]|uniref:Carboxymuconolactone decarboxylase family protein n=1 Tax=Corynebacterium phoceense TaxID=1686286 RepID=A0A540R8C2_9CORY|nr:carboxymuconolactone decarboxylase family protein [Corynebacterium phoceense]TQE43962.1 carboxymuconolactone decarboxylase family protein [Corynebacterium phoceense]